MARRPAAQDSQSAPADPAPRLERIAVLFVHGQGEQTPMTDVVDLVESVWRTDPRAAEPAQPGRAPVYSVPLYDRETSAQRRIVTRIVDNKQVDFYQFYWADLMEGNRFVHLWKWFTALMTRKPSEVPAALWPVRQVTMGIALFVAAWGPALALLTALRLHDGGNTAAAVELGLALLAGFILNPDASILPQAANKAQADKTAESQAQWGLRLILAAGLLLAVYPLLPIADGLLRLAAAVVISLVAGVAAAALLGGALGRLLRSKPPPDWLGSTRAKSQRGWLAVLATVIAAYVLALWVGAEVRAGWRWNNAVALALAASALYAIPAVLRPSRRAGAFGTGMSLIVASLVVSAPLILRLRAPDLPAAPIETPMMRVHEVAFGITFLTALFVGLFGRLLDRSFLVPVMADSARMLSDSPVNIPNQNRIRQRGIELLEMLHNRKGNTQGGQRPYDRIVVLAHSLGSVVAYRLLSHYWGAVYDELAVEAARAQAADVEAAAAALGAASKKGAPVPQPALIAWRKAVRAYWRALNPRPYEAGGARPVRPWLISDFITIGNPLTYARLLLESSDAEFLKQIQLFKRHPTSPPQGRGTDGAGASFGPIFDREGWPHHAALFAATCWTNLFFPHYGLVRGDIVGGVVRGEPPEGLGWGILDVELGDDQTVEGFTHGEYWKWPTPSIHTPGDLPAPMHVAALRDALGLFDAGDPADRAAADQRLLTPRESYLATWPPAQPLAAPILREGAP